VFFVQIFVSSVVKLPLYQNPYKTKTGAASFELISRFLTLFATVVANWASSFV